MVRFNGINVFILIFLFLFIALGIVAFFTTHKYSTRERYVDEIIKLCTISSTKLSQLDQTALNGVVLVYNSTIYAEGVLGRKVIGVGSEYTIIISNGTHSIVFRVDKMRYPLHSKGVFYSVDYIAIYPLNNLTKPLVLYHYIQPVYINGTLAKLLYRSITDEEEMIYMISRLPTHLPHFWLDKVIKKGSMNIETNKHIISIRFVKRLDIDKRTYYIVEYRYREEDTKILTCIDSQTRIPILRLFIGRQSALTCLSNTMRVDEIPRDILETMKRWAYISNITILADIFNTMLNKYIGRDC